MKFRYRTRILATAIVSLVTLTGSASAQANVPQNGNGTHTGRIVGRVIDAGTGQGLVGVILQIEGSSVGALSGVDGRFVLSDVPAGPVSLVARSLGYGTKTVTGVIVEAGAAVEQDLSLDAQAIELDAIEVSAGAERGSVSRALNQQRNATGILNAITSEQISRSPDGDAGAAMQRVSGVTVQDGKYVFVRGLGERYTTTSLNGARIPSPEPERKVVPLDMFPAGLLETITTSKTFTPDQSGDFSGAQVDIRTREFPAARQVTYSFGIGYNGSVTGTDLPFAPTVGSEWLAFAGSDRQVPDPVLNAGSFQSQIAPAEMNRLVDSFRNAWSVDRRSAAPSASMGASVGGTDPMFGQDISYLFSGTYSHSAEARLDEVRAQAIAGPDETALEVDRFEGMTGRTSVLWGGLANISTLVGSRTRLALGATYNRTADNEGRTEFGSSENHGNLPLSIERLRFVERSVRSVQLKGEHELSSRHRADWSLTTSGVQRNEPDRSEVVYATQSDPATGAELPPAWFSVSNEGAVRTFGDLSEDSYEASANYRVAFGAAGNQHFVKLGGAFRSTTRDADNNAYSISTGQLGRADRELDPEEIFDGRFTAGTQSILRVTPLSQGGSYSAEDELVAGYAMVDVGLSSRIRLIGGARVERSAIRVVAQPTIGEPLVAEPEYTDVLPAVAFNISLTGNQNLRLSASQTLSRPEYRELAGIQYREVLGGDNVLGNPELERTLIQNADVRWEWYPNPGEVVSLAVFAKNFDNPIERVYLGTSGTRVVRFVNAESASNYGVEIEIRKGLGLLVESLEPFTAFANATIMNSDIRIGSGGASKTSDERTMVGQAPYVVNAGLTWAPGFGGTSATLLYNVVGERIVSAAEAPLPDIYEQSRNVLDLSLRFALTGSVSAKLDARNILDEPYSVTQGTVTRESWRVGRSFSLGLSWKQ
jgi:hypothetical protein